MAIAGTGYVRLTRIAVLTSHPIQYYGPLFRTIAECIDTHVFFAHRATPVEQAQAGFGIPFDWDVNITDGYSHSFLENIATNPGTDRFGGCDTPDIARQLAQGQFNALLVTGWHLKSFIQGTLAAKRLGIKVLIRGDSQLGTPRSRVKRFVKSATYPALLRVFDAALYVGDHSRSYYRHYHYPESRLHFSPHCVDSEWFRERATIMARTEIRNRFGISEQTKIVLFAGKLLPRKRPLDLIAAVAICRASGFEVEVMVAGAGALECELRGLANSLGVRAHMLGFCNQSEMPLVYAAADALVLPSSGEETWGLVANEAIACGRPVIVSDACGCAPDLTSLKRGGCSYPVGNTEALSKSIVSVLLHGPEARELRDIANCYSLKNAAAGVNNALDQLCHLQ